MRPVKLKTPGGPTTAARLLYVSAEVARHVSDEALFRPELVPEGILFRVVSSPPGREPLPEWVIEGKP